MDYLMGIRGKDFVMVVADTTAVQQIITIKHDEEKIVPVDADVEANSQKLIAMSGEPGDRVQFSEFVIANVRLYALRNDRRLSTHAVAHFTRRELATALRRNPYQTNLLIAGFDEEEGPALYWLDYLATMHKMNIAGTGYGSHFVLSLCDRLWHPDMSEAEALELMEKGIAEVKARLVIAPPSYVIKVVDKNGVREVKRV
jgi:20S proteasome subunit beta 4